MDTSGITIRSDEYEALVLRKLATSNKDHVEFFKQEFGLLMEEVIRITPPASEGVRGAAAERQGKAAAAADIRALYGTPRRAYDDLKVKGQHRAKAFWQAHKQGHDELAAAIVKENTGKSYDPFDPAIHQRMGLGARKRRRDQLVYYVSNPAALNAYITDIQQRVTWLVSGWKKALRALGRALPPIVLKHNAPGHLDVKMTGTQIRLDASNDVRFASNVKGIQRRLDWAINNRRIPKLQSGWDRYLKSLIKAPGTKVT